MQGYHSEEFYHGVTEFTERFLEHLKVVQQSTLRFKSIVSADKTGESLRVFQVTNRIGRRNGWHALTKGKGVALANTIHSGSTHSHKGVLNSRATRPSLGPGVPLCYRFIIRPLKD